MTYTLDTSTCITFLRGQHPQLRQRVLSHFHDIAITAVVAALCPALLTYGELPSTIGTRGNGATGQ